MDVESTVFEKEFLEVLNEELIPAMGCTEPIALAFAASRGASEMQEKPTKIIAYCSGNMIKNVRCVTIPNSDGMIGIEAAVVLGAFGGDYTRGMEVLEAITPLIRKQSETFLKNHGCKVEYLDSDIPLHFIVEMINDIENVKVEVRYSHMNIVSIIKNDSVIYSVDKNSNRNCADHSNLSIDNIKSFSDKVSLDLIKPLFE